ncbi:MAG: peptidoglycan bridge formation glycyltransferase FemA/FemB family protein [Candidatus Moranbacteria bacterium]|jgi:peptidoglycan pentaglycine glycine transferase (the first glycine)|nr:peptidoglycan bridge formation glycyltransferase FemA/FemB family protein [Candidatus Moranbacteria bacterium]MBP9801332.1 peptidoglycan bridge formation glycyltransferase FemA/FemB family protein [Candidatus Moranbacteria bacterium]
MSSFLQSKEWARFQEMSGHEVVQLKDGMHGFVHVLPMVGAYVYTPRFPEEKTSDQEIFFRDLFLQAKNKKCGWVRIEPETVAVLQAWERICSEQGNEKLRLIKSPNDMQPRENLVIDVSKPEETLLFEMKAKTRYNMRLAAKKEVRVFVTREKKYQEIFFQLIEATAKRQHILPHPKSYYQSMFTVFSEEQLLLFVAEYKGEVLAANLVLFSGDTATYLHGGTNDIHREVMAPILLQWEQIRAAKRRSCRWYDFGGVSTASLAKKQELVMSAWEGITRFKRGFSPGTAPVVFPGCYDIVVDWSRYGLYLRLRFLQKSLSVMRKFLRR